VRVSVGRAGRRRRVECRAAAVIVIDAAEDSPAASITGERLIAPFLTPARVIRFTRWSVVPQLDHYGGLAALPSSSTPREFWSNGITVSSARRLRPPATRRRRRGYGAPHVLTATSPARVRTSRSTSFIRSGRRRRSEQRLLVVDLTHVRVRLLFTGRHSKLRPRNQSWAADSLAHQHLPQSPHHVQRDVDLREVSRRRRTAQPRYLCRSRQPASTFPAAAVLAASPRRPRDHMAHTLEGAIQLESDGSMHRSLPPAPSEQDDSVNGACRHQRRL